MPMQVHYTDGNREAAPYGLSRLNSNPEHFAFLQESGFRISAEAAKSVGRGRIQGLAKSGRGLIVAGKAVALPAITIRSAHNERFLKVFVTKDQEAEIGQHFGLDLKELEVIFRFKGSNDRNIFPSWQELFTPQFLSLYRRWLEHPYTLKEEVSFSWMSEPGQPYRLTFPHLPQVCESRHLGSQTPGTASLEEYDGKPLFSWGQGGRKRLSFVMEGGKFRSLERLHAGVVADTDHTPKFDSRKFTSLCEDPSSRESVRGFLMTTGGEKWRALRLGSSNGDNVRIFGSHDKPLEPDTWYWLVTEISGSKVIEGVELPTLSVKVFKNRKDRKPYGVAVFQKSECQGLLGIRAWLTG